MADKIKSDAAAKASAAAKAEKEAERQAMTAKIKKRPKAEPTTTQQEPIMSEEPIQNTPPPKEEPLVQQTTNQDPPTQDPPVQQAANADDAAFGGPNKAYRPFRGNTVKRSYSSEPINHQITQPLREATFEMPKTDTATIESSMQKPGGLIGAEENKELLDKMGAGGGAFQQPQASQQVIPPNPDVSVLPPEEQTRAAEMLVDILIGAYEKLHQAGRHFLKISDEEMTVMEMKDEVSLAMQVPIGTTPTGELKTAPLATFITEYNKSIEENFVVSEDFKKKVRPPLIRSFAKKGWGVTDDQYVFYLIAEDVSTKAFQVIGFKRQMNKFLDLCKTMYNKQKEIENPPAPEHISSPVSETKKEEALVI